MGGLAGNIIGPGFFSAPFLLGTGMNRLAFVGTLATITPVMKYGKDFCICLYRLVNTGINFSRYHCRPVDNSWQLSWSKVLRKMTDGIHEKIVDVMTILF